MKTEVGLWIDHREAVIVMVSGKTEELTQIESRVEKHVRHSGGEQEVTAEDRLDRRYLDHLRQFYDEVVSKVRGADSILVFGPGEAKGEFVKQLQSEDLGGRVVGVETADKMTDRQVASKVREHFLPGSKPPR